MKFQTDIYILNSEWEDTRAGLQLRYHAVSQDHGNILIVIDNQKSTCFIDRDAALPDLGLQVLRKSVELKQFDHSPVDALYFDRHRDLRQAADLLKESGITTYEADIPPHRRYLMERFIHAQACVTGNLELQRGSKLIRNPVLAPASVDPTFKVASIDIETGVSSGRLYTIGAHLCGPGVEEEVVFLLSQNPVPPNGFTRPLATEKALLEAFFNWFRKVDPDIIIGWNVIGFDLDFLDRKCKSLGIKLDLSRNHRPPRIRQRGSGFRVAEVPGRVVIDGPQTLRGAFYSFQDFRLETVAQELLGEGKTVSESGEDKIAEIERLYLHEPGKLAEYNLNDCRLVSRIFEHTELIKLCVRRSQISGMLLDDIGRSVAAFDHIYLPRLHRNGFVAPNADDIIPQGHAAGGYVMTPDAGIYEHVAVLDFKSLYPSIIQSFKIEPLSLLERDIDTIRTPGGHKFSGSRHVLPDYIAELMEQRKAARRRSDRHLSQAIKILMNSFYGVMGSFGCRFYHPDLPAAITGTGQWLLKGCREYLEKRDYQVLYGDTDSVFIKLKAADLSDPEAAGLELAGSLNEHWRETLAGLGVRSFLEMEYEKHYRHFVLPLARVAEGGARKRYAGIVIDTGGAERLEFVGMEYVRSDWTPLAKQFQFQLYSRILKSLDYQDWIREFIRDLRRGQFDEQLIYRKRLKKEAHKYTRNISPQVRAALMLKKPVREIKYLMTTAGPRPLELLDAPIDYHHYTDKQLRPIADSILKLVGSSFAEFSEPNQLRLFDD